jgi:hypothetical protein
VGLFGAFSADGDTMAYLSATGLYLLPEAGTGDPIRLLGTQASGTLTWLP